MATTSTTHATGARTLGRVAAGTMVANVCAYLVHIPAGRFLAPDDYGQFAVLLQALLLLGVPALALQAVTAREVARGREVTAVLRLGAVTIGVVVVAAIVAVPIISAVAHTGLIATAVAAASAPVLVAIAVGQGIYQGRQRFSELALVVAWVGIARTLPAIVGLVLGAGATGALSAMLVGGVMAAVGLWLPLRSDLHGGRTSALPVRTVLAASSVQLVLTVLTSVDLLLSRTVLSDHDAGVYALGTVATKAAFWLPQAVGVVFFPRLADPVDSRRALRTALMLTGALVALSVMGAAVAGPLVPVLVGEAYRPVAGLLWLFALAGGVLALLQVGLLGAIARDRTRVSVIPWAVAVLEIVAVLTVAHTVLGLLMVTVTAAALSASLTLNLAMWGAAERSPRRSR
ncbi:lipopolysaccharide biosynthesis protein [Williamsia sterculiae]|uniref:Membrane protein involved in the export of O-antigen and teichoic acid n=1 Tax=Williamsia sterculiae TaxID=1344003 RepID=A0A1N7CE56_9NOCA|nr:polysaccharide biosynthesis protein [Williamsia sterculiae]SIR61872.1 Membrane protein involved in the export of O-antigen and teichoic acid [Williamsia sterculiae]